MKKAKKMKVAILCPVGPGEEARLEAAMAPWAEVDGVDLRWFGGCEFSGEYFGGGYASAPFNPLGVAPPCAAEFLAYDLRNCASSDPMRREVWVRNRLRNRALDWGAQVVLSIDADEVCLNPRQLISQIVARPDVARWARWRTVVHDDGEFAVGPWCQTAPLERGQFAPGWSEHAGFQLASRGEFSGNGRASNDLRLQSCGMFLHRSWDVARAREKFRTWSHAHHAVDVGIFAVQLEALERCRRDLQALVGVAQGLRNWGPYPGARWPAAAIWRSGDLADLAAEPIWRAI